MNEYLQVARQAADAGAEVLRQWWGRVEAREKAPRDVVTEADLASQQAIFACLAGAYPDHELLGEETAAPRRGDSPFRWIVDPLDGTTNYVHGLPNYSVSVALEQDGQIIVAVVYDPWADECFWAARGEGAFLNDLRIATTDCGELDAALVAASFSARVPRDSPEISRFIEMLVACQALRRLGSAALNLCYVAGGRLDGYWATSVKSWDVAAGSLILEEAGGTLSSITGGPFDLEAPTLIAAANPQLHRRMRACLDRAVSAR